MTGNEHNSSFPALLFLVQVEMHFPDGIKEIIFPDSTRKVINPDGLQVGTMYNIVHALYAN